MPIDIQVGTPTSTGFDPSVGTSTSTAYLTVEEADAYHRRQPYSADRWASRDIHEKERLLMRATEVLDAMITWEGARGADEVEQRLEWPRYGMWDRSREYILDNDYIPRQLKDAVAEFAGQLITADRTADDPLETQRIWGLSVGNNAVNLQFDKPRAKVVPDNVIYLLVPWWIRDVRQRSSRAVTTVGIIR